MRLESVDDAPVGINPTQREAGWKTPDVAAVRGIQIR